MVLLSYYINRAGGDLAVKMSLEDALLRRYRQIEPERVLPHAYTGFSPPQLSPPRTHIAPSVPEIKYVNAVRLI